MRERKIVEVKARHVLGGGSVAVGLGAFLFKASLAALLAFGFVVAVLIGCAIAAIILAADA